jgi:hypothetical protein
MQATEANLTSQLLARLSVRLGKHVNSGRFFYHELTDGQAKLFHAVLKRSDMEDVLNDWLLEGCANFHHKHGQIQVLSSNYIY